jgi:hypothetical protein
MALTMLYNRGSSTENRCDSEPLTGPAGAWTASSPGTTKK